MKHRQRLNLMWTSRYRLRLEAASGLSWIATLWVLASAVNE